MHVKIKEVETHFGQRDSKQCGNFLWDMEKFLEEMVGVSDEAKVNETEMYLIVNFKIWWKILVGDVSFGRMTKWVECLEYLK